MTKILWTFLVLMSLSIVGFSQNETVTFDYLQNNFNDNRPLPSGENFMIKGNIHEDVSVVSFALFRNHRRKDTLYSTTWRRPVGGQKGRFLMPVDFKLHGNKEYDIVFHFYRKVSEHERLELLEVIKSNLKNYLESEIEVTSRRVSFHSSVNTMMEDMKKIVQSAFTFYQHPLFGNFSGFSDRIKQKLRQLNHQKITSARYNVAHDTDIVKSQVRQRYAMQLQSQLLKAVIGEVNPYVGENLVILEDIRERKNYPTEQISRTLSLDIGYGGVYLSGEWVNMDYVSAPYAGISFPLGNESISPFWGRTSISLGVFLKNFEDKEGNKITGPVVGLPYYLGMGYKFLHIMRIQAGVVATSTKEIDQIQNISTKDISLQPFIGIGAEINLWLGFDKRK